MGVQGKLGVFENNNNEPKSPIVARLNLRN